MWFNNALSPTALSILGMVFFLTLNGDKSVYLSCWIRNIDKLVSILGGLN